MDVRVIDTVQHQIHRGDAKHGRVKIKAVEHGASDMLAVRFQQVAGVDLLRSSGFEIGFLNDGFGRRVGPKQVLHDID